MASSYAICASCAGSFEGGGDQAVADRERSTSIRFFTLSCLVLILDFYNVCPICRICQVFIQGIIRVVPQISANLFPQQARKPLRGRRRKSKINSPGVPFIQIVGPYRQVDCGPRVLGAYHFDRHDTKQLTVFAVAIGNVQILNPGNFCHVISPSRVRPPYSDILNTGPQSLRTIASMRLLSL